MPGLLTPWRGLLFAVFLCLLAFSPSALSASPEESAGQQDSDQTFPSGIRVAVPKGRASFLVPPGWNAQLPEESEAVVLVSESGAGFIMVFMILNVGEDELMQLLAEPQPMTHDLVFQPSGTVTKRGNRMAAEYEAGSLSGRALTVMGPDQQGVLFFLGRPRADTSPADRVLNDLANSVEFSPAP